MAGDAKLADALIKYGNLVEYKKGGKLITEGGEDNDIYSLLAGAVAVVVKGNEIAIRKAGQHVGEMGAIERAPVAESRGFRFLGGVALQGGLPMKLLAAAHATLSTHFWLTGIASVRRLEAAPSAC